MRKRYFLVLLLVIAGILGYTIFGETGLIHLVKLRRELKVMRQENVRLRQENERLRAQARALRSDLKYIEKVAREELGMVKKDEQVYQFKE
ncbi:MAG: septum formation initiator family protein [Deltaproteobacteria bacterium]|nr:MAG: septum formation initiator family protein [Deltaproteobacteria bacterium]